MISASHNPYHDNGIKLFGPDGFKLSDEIELEIETLMVATPGNGLAAAADLGRARRIDDARGRYIENVKSSFPRGLTLNGLKIVVDSAHGAAYHLAADLFFELGADVVRIGTEPNGLNINDGCGSTSPAALRAAVLREGADLGVALDGDADRVVLVDNRGDVVDGDQLLALIATSWQADRRLRGEAVVATIMSNLGLERHLAGLGLGLQRTKVGDRYVVERMRAAGCNVGGEQSGHIILSDFATTGDGLLAALQAVAVIRQRDRPASDIVRVFAPVPQQLRNVMVQQLLDLEAPEVALLISREQARLDGTGRLLVRASGTEPVIRIMVEAEDEGLLADVLDTVSYQIAALARRAA
jgi:phosphoglucosamine mutase